MRAILVSMLLLTACGELPYPEADAGEPDAGELDAGTRPETAPAKPPVLRTQDAGTADAGCQPLQSVTGLLGAPSCVYYTDRPVAYIWDTDGAFTCATLSGDDCLQVTGCALPPGGSCL